MSSQAVMNPQAIMNSEIQFILGPYTQSRSGGDFTSWYDSVSEAQGTYWAQQFLATETILVNSNHYDLPLCLYLLYYRTGDATYLDYARQVAKKWWESQYINQGRPVGGGDNPGPLYTGTLGLALWALDTNPPNVFGFLDRVAREWMEIRLLGHINDPNIYTDMREEGYIQLTATVLAKVLPDTYSKVTWDNDLNLSVVTVTDGAARRAQYLKDAERVAVDYFARLQKPDGSWRWAQWNAEPALAAKLEQFGNSLEQPFMVGIYMESVTRLHQLSSDPAVKASLLSQMTKHCDHLMRDAFVPSTTPGVTSIPRVLLYFYPRDYIFDPTASDRHLTTSVIHTFGYLYSITGNVAYKNFGDELWNSCFAAAPVDDLRSAMDQKNYVKLFTGEFRSSGQYLVWRASTPSQKPIPEPLPEQKPTPDPVPDPKPIPTPLPTVPEEYRTKAMANDTKAARSALYQKMFKEGWAAYAELSGLRIKFRRFR